jgi:hypothetical protein
LLNRKGAGRVSLAERQRHHHPAGLVALRLLGLFLV